MTIVIGALAVLLLLLRSSSSSHVPARTDEPVATPGPAADSAPLAEQSMRPALVAGETLERPQEEPRALSHHRPPPGGVRPWRAEAVELALPTLGEQVPVRAHRLETYDAAKPGPAPNPLMPPKQQLSFADTRAGLDTSDEVAP